MTPRLHLLFVGELTRQNVFKDMGQIHIVGMYPDYASAFSGCKAGARRRVDSAQMRYFIAHPQRLREDGPHAADAEAMQA